MKPKKLQAGALQLTMFITVIIALLLAAFILFVHTHKQFKLQTQVLKETVDKADKGMHYALGHDIPLNDTVQIQLKEDTGQSLKAHRDYWGLFEKVTISTSQKQFAHKKIALIGGEQPPLERTALYVVDNNKPLVVVGNTFIQGTAYLPKQGVRTGHIAGHAYYGPQLIYGSTKTSKALPKLNKETLQVMATLPNTYKTLEQNQFLDLGKTRTHQNSFFNPLLIVYSKEPITLSGVSLTGHIQVQSETKITVETSAVLRDIVLIAPIIDIKFQVKGNFQAMATKQLRVGKNCRLDYPSALILNDGSKQNGQPTNDPKNLIQLKLEQDAQVKGIIAYLGQTKNYKPQIAIEEGVEVTGEVYCDQNLELLGAVNGTVLTSNFIAQQSGSAYQNHIYNGTITIDKRPTEYVGLAFETTTKNIVQWLY